MASLKFSKLASLYEELEHTSSNNKQREILSTFFKKTSKEDIDKIAYMTLGKIGPEYKKIDLGMAEKMVIKAIGIAFNKKDVKAEFKKKGDVGIIAESFAKGKGSLTVKQVFENLWNIQKATGAGSQERKISILVQMLKRSSPLESRYIPRIALGTLRLGAGTQTILDALAIAFLGGKKNKKALEAHYNVSSDLGAIAKMAKEGKVTSSVAFGRPIKMMLAQRVKLISDILKKIPGKVAAEEKYDGERLQIHKKGNDVAIYSRRATDITSQWPDVVRAVTKQISAKDCIVEGEVVAVKGNMILPFQKLMKRRRKHDVEKYAKEIPSAVYLFDLLHLNGRSMIEKDFLVRRKALEKILKKGTKLRLAKHIITDKLPKIEEFFKKSLARGCEGIITKSCAPGSRYQSGTRGWNWIKWKREYLKNVRETFDLVVVGAFAGRGTRSGAYGALLCASYNKTKKRFETFCKAGSGFTDKQLKELPKKLARYKVEKHKDVLLKMKPDVLFKPALVIEVLGAEVTKSPSHTCGIDKFKDKGLALRFPRFTRWRDDKGPKDATTTREIIMMFK